MAHTGSQFFGDSEENAVRKAMFPDATALQKKYSFIFKHNQPGQYTTITFESRKNDYENAVINISFNQEAESMFQNNLPK